MAFFLQILCKFHNGSICIFTGSFPILFKLCGFVLKVNLSKLGLFFQRKIVLGRVSVTLLIPHLDPKDMGS